MTRQALDNVSSRYGAPLGRPSSLGAISAPSARWAVSRIRINRQGYDTGGAYWGVGSPLYWCGRDDGAEFFARAADRSAMKAEVLRRYLDATFYR